MSSMKVTLSMAIAGACAMTMLFGAGASAGGGFSKRSIKGSYATTFQGTVLNESGTPLPIAGTAVITADGQGHISGHESFVFDGAPCTDVASTGTYTVNPDGSGTASFTFSSSTSGCSGSYTQSLVIADSGRIVVLNNTNEGNQISETWRQQGFPPF
jgi:hypothetical protein